MNLGLDCPALKLFSAIQPFADYDYIIASRVLKDKKYEAFFAERKSRFKILDVRDTPSVSDARDAFDRVSASAILVPLDNRQQHDGCSEALGVESVITIINASDYRDFYAQVGIVGGAVAIPHDICSPKDTSPIFMELRRALLVVNLPSDRLVHLLGMTTVHELPWYSGKPNILSISTSVPVVLGLQGKDILDVSLSVEGGVEIEGEKALGDLTNERWAALCRNIALLRKFMA